MELHQPGISGDDHQSDHIADSADHTEELNGGQDDVLATAATVAVVGAGVLVFEAALLPGLVLGIATMLVPKHLSKLGAAVSPLVRSTVRGAYALGQKTKEMVAEVQEHVHDIVAEVEAESDRKPPAAKTTGQPGFAPGESALRQ